MTGRATPPWPGVTGDTADAFVPYGDLPATSRDDEALGRRLEDAVDAADAPDVVLAFSRHGHRTLRWGGTAPPPPVPRPELRYELGSASKTFTGLLLAQLIRRGLLSGGETAVGCLDPGRSTGPAPVTLAHLVTHTSGLPALPGDFFPRALPAWRTNPYARYPAGRVIDAFLRHRPRHRPGTRWHYSNFGVAVLGHAITGATGTGWEELLAGHVLRPLALSDTGTRALGPGADAVGHRKDGRTPVPAFDAGGFRAAGAVRATPATCSPSWRPTSPRLPSRWPGRCCPCTPPSCGVGWTGGTCTRWAGSVIPPTAGRCTSTAGRPWASRRSWASGPTRAAPWRPCAPGGSGPTTRSWPPPTHSSRSSDVEREHVTDRSRPVQSWRRKG